MGAKAVSSDMQVTWGTTPAWYYCCFNTSHSPPRWFVHHSRLLYPRRFVDILSLLRGLRGSCRLSSQVARSSAGAVTFPPTSCGTIQTDTLHDGCQHFGAGDLPIGAKFRYRGRIPIFGDRRRRRIPCVGSLEGTGAPRKGQRTSRGEPTSSSDPAPFGRNASGTDPPCYIV